MASSPRSISPPEFKGKDFSSTATDQKNSSEKAKPIIDSFTGVNQDDQSSTVVSDILPRLRMEEIRKIGLGLRTLGAIFCLISFSVMAADRNRGWAEDSFNKYREYRYCISVTVIAFIYSVFQLIVQAYSSITNQNIITTHLRYYEFFMDQVLAYLLISASSSAAVRSVHWKSDNGKDKFVDMAYASFCLSFLAFFCFALSCLVSGYNLCNKRN